MIVTPRKVGLVAARSSGASEMADEAGWKFGLGTAVKQIDALRAGHKLPVETELVPAEARLNPEFSGYLLGGRAPYRSWLRELDAQAALAYWVPPARAVATGATIERASLIFSPFEDHSFIAPAQAAKSAAWIETSGFSSAGVQSAYRAAQQAAHERKLPGPFFVTGIYEPAEAFALSFLRATHGDDLRTLSVEEMSRQIDAPAVYCALGRTAQLMARWLGAAGWVAWSPDFPVLAQCWDGGFSPLILAAFLDRMGLVAEGAQLEELAIRAWRETAPAAIAAGNPRDVGNVNEQICRVLGATT